MITWPGIFKKRWVRWTAGLLVLAIAVWSLTPGLERDDEIEWVKAQRDDLVLGVEVTGTLKAVDTSSLGPPQVPRLWEFKIAFMAPEGAEVKKGQPVLGFDNSELQRKLEEKIAERDQAQKEIEKKQAQLTLARQDNNLRLAEAQARKRKAELKVEVPENLSASNELRTAQLDLQLAIREISFVTAKLEASRRSGDSELEALYSQRDRARARVAEIRQSIEDMTVKAPRDGTVIYVSNWRDEKKKVGDPCWRGETVLEIPDLKKMKAEGEVDEADASRVGIGQAIDFRLDAHPDEKFTGKVSFIWDTVRRKSWRNPLKVVRLDIELDRTDEERMRPGMRFRGSIETERVEDVVIIPLECVFLREGETVVYRKTLMGFEAVPVKLGKRNEDQVEVVEGLREGHKVSRTDPTATARRGA